MIRIEVTGGQLLPEDISRENWAGMMTDIQLFQPAIDNICSALNLRKSAGPAAGHPGSSAVFVIDDLVVIKLYPPIFAADYAIELAAYERLNGQGEEIPVLFAAGTYKDRIDWPFLVFQFCPGVPIRDVYPRLASADRIRLAGQVGEVLKSVYQTAVIPVWPFKPWQGFVMQRGHECPAELRENTPLPPDLVSRIEAFLKEILPDLLHEQTHLLNADLTDDHILITQENGSWDLEAIIDWGDAQIGQPLYEWIAAWFGFCRMDAPMFRALMAAATPRQAFDVPFKRKLLACTFLHRFGPLIIQERWQAAPPPAELTLSSLAAWLWPGIME
jgi:hygromycin-B 7''-O-kinase